MHFARNLRKAVAVFATVASLSIISTGAGAQNIPAAGTDDAKLYEAAKGEKTLSWYVSAPLEAMRGVADEFEKKYPGIKVDVLRIVGVAQYQRFMMETQAQQYIADVMSNSDEPSMADLIERGYVAEWKVPSFDRLPPDMRIKTNAYSPSLNSDIIVYNTNKVTPEEAKILTEDWKGLLDPRFKGRLAATDQKTGATYAAVHMLLDPKFKDRYGETFMQAIAAQKVKIYNDTVIVADRVVAGEVDIGILVGENGGAATSWAAGAPIRWVFPKPTPVWGTYWQGISKFAQHPNAARLFQNWATGEEGMKALQTRAGSATTLTGVADERKVAKESWYLPITDRYTPDWARWEKNFDKDMELWNKLLKGGQ